MVDVEGRSAHVHRGASDKAWQSRTLHDADDTISPLCLPDLQIRVGDLFPEPQDS